MIAMSSILDSVKADQQLARTGYRLLELGDNSRSGPDHQFGEAVSLSSLDTSWHPKVADAVEWARRWQKRCADYPGASYVLSSQQKGVGKTHVLRAIWWSQCMGPVDVLGEPVGNAQIPSNPFFMADELFQRIYGTKGEGVEHLIKNRNRFVCIDDLGTESKPEYCSKDSWNRERQVNWFKVFNHCYENEIGMILTTNLNWMELEQWIGERAFSRLMHMAPAGFMRDLNGVPDWRKAESGR